ncbi:hypothetical protein HAX54_026288, partial [Datura stramonium]|nr:hypothetical protein [Datura stramonium]
MRIIVKESRVKDSDPRTGTSSLDSKRDEMTIQRVGKQQEQKQLHDANTALPKSGSIGQQRNDLQTPNGGGLEAMWITTTKAGRKQVAKSN